MLYLTILEGPSPAEALPILSTHDPELINAVAQVLAQRLGGDRDVARALRLIPQDSGESEAWGREPRAVLPPARSRSPRGAETSATTGGTLQERLGTPPAERICAWGACRRRFTPPTRRRGSERLYCSRRCCRLASRARCAGRADEPALSGDELGGTR